MANEIERRIPFRRVLKQSIERVMQAGAEGVKVSVSGRLNGADIARRETLSDGKIPLTTLRADVNYAMYRANTIYGVIGVKVWINRGELTVDEDEDTPKDVVRESQKTEKLPRRRKSLAKKARETKKMEINKLESKSQS